MSVLDSGGQSLTRGSRVSAWHDGHEYTATVRVVLDVPKPSLRCQPEGYCLAHRHLVLARDGDGGLMPGFSDLVTVIP